MDMVFVRQGEYKKGDKAFPLIKECFSLYARELDLDHDTEMSMEIRRTGKGRPYFFFSDLAVRDMSEPAGSGLFGKLEEEAEFDLSVTHSGDIWICMISQGRCGIDFQYVRYLKEQKIADRFFQDGERAFIGSGGDFFDIWCRKEALGKYAGGGFFDDYPDTCQGGVPVEELEMDGKEVFVRSITAEMLEEAGIQIDEPWRAAYVSESDEKPRIILV